MTSSNPFIFATQRLEFHSWGVGLMLAFGSICMPIGAQAQSIPGWDLVWADEFSQADGTSPDSAKWGYDIGGGGWGNNEWQYYTDRTNNVRIEDDQLIIEAHEESFEGRDYTSARLLTKNKWTWTYGRMEARIKVAYGQGIWPAFWMLGDNINTVGWPNCGELDIMEHIGRDPSTVYGTIHGPGYSGGGGVGGSTVNRDELADDFHVFAMEWETNIIRWYIDGFNYFTASPASIGGSTWVFDHPHFFLLNLAVGGNWPGYPDETTVFPQQLRVDYVRVYSRTNVPVPPTTPGTNVLVNPGFEASSLAPWIGYAAGGANNLGGYVESTSDTYYNGGNPGGANVLTHSGTYVGKTFGDFVGSENNNGFYQELPAEPGSLWNAEGWALTHQDDLMSGGNTTWIEVSFRNSANTTLALYRSGILDSANVTVSSWMHLPVTNEVNIVNSTVTNTVSSLVAPEGTTKVRYQIVFRQPANAGGAMYYDDLSLMLQPEDVPVILNASLVGNDIQISFATQTGVNYQVAFKTNLAENSWTLIETIMGDGTTKSVAYPANGPIRFYTLLEAP